MGLRLRRFKERARQNWHLTLDRSFPATVNHRNEAMMREAGTFALNLRRVEKDIRSVKDATEGLLNTTRMVMSAPLPRIYEDSGNGRVIAQVLSERDCDNLIGGDFSVEDLQRVSRDTSRQLDAEVLAPMGRWNAAFQSVEVRMKRLEAIRLEVDSRRRTEADLSMKVEKQRDNLPKTGAKGNDQMQDTIRELQHKQNKLAAAQQSFLEHEALVHTQLSQLIKDGVWLKSYIAAVMRVEQTAFMTAFQAMGPSRPGVGVSQSITESLPAPEPPRRQTGSLQSPNYTSPASMVMNKVVSRLKRNPANNGQPLGTSSGKDSSVFEEAPVAPTHLIGANTGNPQETASRYNSNRYGDSSVKTTYGNQQVPAW